MSHQREPSLADIGEFGLIERLTARLPTSDLVLLGPGDDTALVTAPDGRVVITTDLLVQDHHFRLQWSSPEDVGAKAVAANLADVAAMGAVPTVLVVGFGAPATLSAQWALRCGQAMADEAASAGAVIVGGDVVAAAHVTIAITALGDLAGRAPVRRSGARPGDVLAVAGSVGWSAAGLSLLRAGLSEPAVLVGAHRRPTPPYAAGPQAALAGATAMIDVSDGLIADARHIAEASRVTVELASDRLQPGRELTQAADCLGVDPLIWIMQGGEDHALLATFDPAVRLPDGFTVIGQVHSSGSDDVLVDGQAWVSRGGFDHFAAADPDSSARAGALAEHSGCAHSAGT